MTTKVLNLPDHEATKGFPTPRGADFETLKLHVADHDIRPPIVLLDGKILDGRARLRACRDLGFDVFPEDCVEINNVSPGSLGRRLCLLPGCQREYAARQIAQRLVAAGWARNRIAECLGLAGQMRRLVPRASRNRKRRAAGAIESRTKGISGGPRVSATVRRWVERFGEIPRYSVIGRAIGMSGEAARKVLQMEMPWRDAQEAVAKFAGVSVETLFGDAAWHVRAGRALREQQQVPA